MKVEKLRLRPAGFDFVLAADFTVRSGERVALPGRSGVGKTTLLRVLAGLEPLSSTDSGRVILGGQDITHAPARRRDIGLVFQDQLLFPALDVLGNVCFGLRVRGVSVSEAESHGMSWLERVGLKTKGRASVGSLSGGERQRVAWARALIWKPKLILLDEPFTALDSNLKDALRRELLDLHAIAPAPMILVSHDERDVEAIATKKLQFRETDGGRLREVLFDR